MNRTLGLVLIAALLGVAWLGYSQPQLFPGNLDVPGLVWAIMALLLVSGAGYGFARFKRDRGVALAGAVFWSLLIVAITLAYPLFN
jgi:hypothetical protein